MRPGITGIDPVVFKHQRFMSVTLRTERAALIFRKAHALPTLVGQAIRRQHDRAAFASSFHRRRKPFLKTHGMCGGGGFRQKARRLCCN